MVDALKQKIVESHKPVGVKKQSNWKLPPSDFAYGFKVKPDAEDVSVITRSWVEHKPSKPIESKPDFITINKIAVEKKIVDPKVRSCVLYRPIRNSGKLLTSDRKFRKERNI
jgi:hypothetical protein